MGFKTSSPRRDFMAMPRLVNHFRTEEDKVIGKSGDERRAIRIGVHDKSEQQKRSENPGEPLNFDGQNKKDVDDLVGIKSGEGEEQRRDQHAVGKIAAEEKRSHRCADHPHDEIKGEPERAPCTFETFAEKPKKPEHQHDPKAECLRNKDVGDESPNFAVANARRIEIERESEAGIEPHQRPHESGEANHDADQSRYAEKTKAALEFIQPRHWDAR